MATDGKVPILESARAGFTFMLASLRVVAPAAVLGAALQALMEITYGNPLALLPSLASLAMVISFLAFVNRLAVRGDATGFYGLKFGKDELNLVGALIVVAFFVLIVLVVGVVVVSFALAAAAPQSGVDLLSVQQSDQAAAGAAVIAILLGPGGWMVWIVIAAIAALMLWILARLSLWTAATIGEGKIVVFSAWEWTRGNGARIAVLLLGSLIVTVGLSFILSDIGRMIGVTAAGGLLTGSAGPRALLAFFSALVQFFLLTPFWAGIMAHLYRGLRPPELAAPSAT